MISVQSNKPAVRAELNEREADRLRNKCDAYEAVIERLVEERNHYRSWAITWCGCTVIMALAAFLLLR